MRIAFTQRITLLLFVSSLFWNGCARIFTPTQPQYQQYQIDETLPVDSTIISYYLPYKQQLETEMNRVVGHTAVSLTKPGDSPETLLGNFFADALLEEGKKMEPRIGLSFGTKGGLRRELHKGEITIGDMFELMPFENELVVLELSADHIRRLVDFIIASKGQPVAGLQLHIRNGQAEKILIGGSPIHADSTYHLVTYDYLANGGDNLRGLDNPINRMDLGKKVRESLIDYVIRHTENNEMIHAKIEGRITSDE